MKKPVLLLVDDDRAVLEALEADLAPQFSELCRVESFDDPSAVLEMLPQWTSEERSIAVAIVDQKMPGLTGVELLTKLRTMAAESPAEAFASMRHMRAVLLTGYAGLDSALAAKNAAGVDRYVEKPWEPAAMHRQVRQLLRAHHVQAGSARHLLFRELFNAGELRQQFRLRYEVYAMAPDLVYLLPRTASRLALDAHDLVSHFYGLFAVHADGEDQVGGVRVIGEESAAAQAVIAIAQEDDVLRTVVSKHRDSPIELPRKWPDPAAVIQFMEGRAAAGERLVEISRLVLAASERAAGLGRSPAALALLEGVAAATGFVRGVENTVLHCSFRHTPAYSAFGFQRIPGMLPAYSESSKENMVALWARPEWVPQPARPRVLAIAAATRRTGSACRCSNFPACTGGPYETGDFTSSDMMCPRLMLERTRPTSVGPAPRDPSGAEFEG